MSDVSGPYRYDVATALSQGARPYQEDSLFSDFAAAGGNGFAVLADGMGGHAAGDVASQMIVDNLSVAIKDRLADPAGFEAQVAPFLRTAIEAANTEIAEHVSHNPSHLGMGATVVAPVLFGNRLYWASVGDSPLYMFRGGELRQINEDHSMAGQIELMVQNGQLTPEQARNHPDRNALTSVLMGEPISRMDASGQFAELRAGDVIVAASDGIQYLEDDVILGVLRQTTGESSETIARAFLGEIEALDDPNQDNVSICVIQLATEDRGAKTRQLDNGKVVTTRILDEDEVSGEPGEGERDRSERLIRTVPLEETEPKAAAAAAAEPKPAPAQEPAKKRGSLAPLLTGVAAVAVLAFGGYYFLTDRGTGGDTDTPVTTATGTEANGDDIAVSDAPGDEKELDAAADPDGEPDAEPKEIGEDPVEENTQPQDEAPQDAEPLQPEATQPDDAAPAGGEAPSEETAPEASPDVDPDLPDLGSDEPADPMEEGETPSQIAPLDTAPAGEGEGTELSPPSLEDTPLEEAPQSDGGEGGEAPQEEAPIGEEPQGAPGGATPEAPSNGGVPDEEQGEEAAPDEGGSAFAAPTDEEQQPEPVETTEEPEGLGGSQRNLTPIPDTQPAEDAAAEENAPAEEASPFEAPAEDAPAADEVDAAEEPADLGPETEQTPQPRTESTEESLPTFEERDANRLEPRDLLEDVPSNRSPGERPGIGRAIETGTNEEETGLETGPIDPTTLERAGIGRATGLPAGDGGRR